MILTIDSVTACYNKLNYPIHPKFNLFAFRSKEQFTNTFNDLCGYFIPGLGLKAYNATTDPGILEDGRASMKAGFYLKLYGFGFHKGNLQHPCFKQISPAEYYRAKDGEQFPPESLFKGNIGTNLHSTKPDWTPEEVDNFSKGCIVIRRWASMQLLLSVARKSGLKQFDFALIREKDIV